MFFSLHVYLAYRDALSELVRSRPKTSIKLGRVFAGLCCSSGHKAIFLLSAENMSAVEGRVSLSAKLSR